jgi:hypothetical protein
MGSGRDAAMTKDYLGSQAIIEALRSLEGSDLLQEMINANREVLLTSPEIARDLVREVAASDDLEPTPQALVLEALINEARMDGENGGASGERFLSNLREAVAADVHDGGVGPIGLLALAHCYSGAGVEVPGILVDLVSDQAEDMSADPAEAMENLDRVLGEMRRELGDDPYAFHGALCEILALAPTDARGQFAVHVLSRDESLDTRLTLYFLLDPQAEVRAAVAGLVRDRAEAGSLDGDLASWLVLVRSWMPEDAARRLVDDAVRAAQRRELAGQAADADRQPVEACYASLPDGSGSQTLAAALGKGRKRSMALVLIKRGHGVKDAFRLPVKTKAEQQQLLAEFGEVDLITVDADTLQLALAAALGESLEAGQPPAHGLVDLVESVGLRALRPVLMTPGDWLNRVDPDGEIAAMPDAVREGLLALSEQWASDYQTPDSWFEDTADLRERLSAAKGKKKQEAVVWAYLNERRAEWARLFLQCAHLLRADSGTPPLLHQMRAAPAWQPFAATAAALLGDRDIKTLPIMGYIQKRTLDAAKPRRRRS